MYSLSLLVPESPVLCSQVAQALSTREYIKMLIMTRKILAAASNSVYLRMFVCLFVTAMKLCFWQNERCGLVL